MIIDVGSELRLDSTALVLRNLLAADEQLEGVRHFNLMQRGKRNLPGRTDGRPGAVEKRPGTYTGTSALESI